MTLLIDYAWTHPDPHRIKAAGHDGVLRYLTGTGGKAISTAELAALHGAGLTVGFVYETTATRAGEGHGAGAADGQAALRAAAALRIPAGVALYFAVDQDVPVYVVTPYFQGVNTVVKSHPVGVYGSDTVVDGILLGGLARYGWQTVAWSGGRLSKVAHIYQRNHLTVPPIGGVAAGSYDENAVLKADWGGWPPTGILPPPRPSGPPAPVPPAPTTKGFLMALSDAEQAEVLAAARAVVRGDGGSWLYRHLYRPLRYGDTGPGSAPDGNPSLTSIADAVKPAPPVAP